MKNIMKKREVYLDNAANTRLDGEILNAMIKVYKNNWGNAAGIHLFAQNMYNLLEDSRAVIADILHCRPADVYFTSSATESNNTVLKGVARALQDKGRHIIISQGEHASVYETACCLRQQGFEVTELPIDQQGYIKPEDLKAAIRADTILVSLIFVNNELGTIQPIRQLGKICREARVYFHTDAVQAFGKLPIDVNELNVDLLTASSHKIFGPLGAGLLYKGSSVPLEPLHHGGGQESGVRSGSVNVPAIFGFAQAAKIYGQRGQEEDQHIAGLRTLFISGLDMLGCKYIINGDPGAGINTILNLSFPGLDAELLSMALSANGVAVSTGASCSGGKVAQSRILRACGYEQDRIRSAIRISFGRFNVEDDIHYLLQILPDILKQVRRAS